MEIEEIMCTKEENGLEKRGEEEETTEKETKTTQKNEDCPGTFSREKRRVSFW